MPVMNLFRPPAFAAAIALWLAASAVHVPAAHARIVALGPPVLVTTTRFYSRPYVVPLPDGGFLVIWIKRCPTCGDFFPRPGEYLLVSTVGRRFDATGRPVGEEFVFEGAGIGPLSLGEMNGIALLGSQLVMTLAGDRFDAEQFPPMLGLFELDGTLVHTRPIAVPPRLLSLGATSDGQVLHISSELRMFGRYLDAGLGQVGEDFPITDPETYRPKGAVSRPLIRSDGSFIAVGQTFTTGSLHGRIIGPDDLPVGAPFEIEESPVCLGGCPWPPAACQDETEAVVIAWGVTNRDFGYPIRHRRFNRDGVAVSQRLSAAITGSSADPLACLSSGRVVVVGLARNFATPDLGPASVVARAFTGDNRPAGHFTLFRSGTPATAALGEDTFVVVSTRCDEDHCLVSGYSIFAQRFHLVDDSDCPGDCDSDGHVTIDELVIAVRLALSGGCEDLLRCPAVETSLDLDCRVTVDEIIAAANRAQEGCE